jgi:hypothetical protein
LLWLLLALFAMPFAIVAALYLFNWRPAQAGNHGEIVAGAPALPFASLANSDGTPLPVDTLGGRWTLLLATSGECSANCRERLDLVRRLHVALNKSQPRVRRLLLTDASGQDAALPAIRAAWPDLVVAGTGDDHWRALLASIPPGEVRLFVLDPEGRPVLRYPMAFDARLALRDVERLLKLSWIG